MLALLDHEKPALKEKPADEEMKNPESEPVATEEASMTTLKGLWGNLFRDPCQKTIYDSQQFESIEKLKLQLNLKK